MGGFMERDCHEDRKSPRSMQRRWDRAESGSTGGHGDRLSASLMSKRLELLCELVPQATMIALLVNGSNAIAEATLTILRMRPDQGCTALYPERREPKRDRCGFCNPRPAPRHAHCRSGCLLR